MSPLAKTVERLILPSLSSAADLAPHQHGFRAGRGTTTALFELSDAILHGFNQQKPAPRTIAFALDLSRAFDMVLHDILLHDLTNLAIPLGLVRWLAAYLSGRRYRVLFRSALSTPWKKTCDLPQGSDSKLLEELSKLKIPDHPIVSPSHSDATILDKQEVRSQSSTLSKSESNSPPVSDKCKEGTNSNQTQADASVTKSSDSLPETQSKELYPELSSSSLILSNTASLHISSHQVEATAPTASFTCEEFALPQPLCSEELRGYYVNATIDHLDQYEAAFLNETRSITLSVHESLHKTVDEFSHLLAQFLHYWSQWRHVSARMSGVRNEVGNLINNLWKIEESTRSVDGRCRDRRKVVLSAVYQSATLQDRAVNELRETNDILRWSLLEELPSIAYKLVALRNQISEYLLRVLTRGPVYRDISYSDPIELVSSASLSDEYLSQLADLRSISCLLFTELRKCNQSNGCSMDKQLASHLCYWIKLTLGTVVRRCRPTDHLFILFQILRLPQRLLKPCLCLIQPPDPNRQRSRNLTSLLQQPEIELVMTLFAACLQPVRSRASFVPGNPKDGESSEQEQPRWMTIDSAGESDLEDDGSSDSTRSDNEESSIYVAPQHLSVILGQLRFDRLIDLITAATTQSDTDLLTLVAFADRFIQLVEQCGAIYSDHVTAPTAESHLGAWRLLTKRLAGLLSQLIKAVSSHIHSAWSQYASLQPASQLDMSQLLAQHDALCLRAASCLLAHSCGLPPSHRAGLLLVCWRHVGLLLVPFGLASSQAKLALFNSLIESVLSSTFELKPDGGSVGDQLILPLYLALRSNGLVTASSDIHQGGTVAWLTALAKLASVECRPVQLSDNQTSSCVLPSHEQWLVGCIVEIIFGLSVYHSERVSISKTSKAAASTRSIPVGLLSVAPLVGRRLLLGIAEAHPNLVLHQLFKLVMRASEQLTNENVEFSQLTRKLSPLIGLLHSEQYEPIEQLLTKLVAELPLHLFNPTRDELVELTDTFSLEHSRFSHKLARSFLSRLSWEAVKREQPDTAFIALPLQLFFASTLCELVEKHSSFVKQNDSQQRLLGDIVQSVKGSVQTVTSNVTDRFLTSIHSHQANILHSTLKATSSHMNRSRSLTNLSNHHDPGVNQIIDWAIDLVARLRLPGAMTLQLDDKSIETRQELARTWSVVLGSQLTNNPVASFLLLSLGPAQLGTGLDAEQFRLVLDPLIDTSSHSPAHISLLLKSLHLLMTNLFRHSKHRLLSRDWPELGRTFNRLIGGDTVQSRLLMGLLVDVVWQSGSQPASVHTFLLSLLDFLTSSNEVELWSPAHSWSSTIYLLDRLVVAERWALYQTKARSSTQSMFQPDQSDELLSLFASVVRAFCSNFPVNQPIQGAFWSHPLTSSMITTFNTWTSSALHSFKRQLPSIELEVPVVLDKSDSQFLSSYGLQLSMFAQLWPMVIADHNRYSKVSRVNSFPFTFLQLVEQAEFNLQLSSTPQSIANTGLWYRLEQAFGRHRDEMVRLCQGKSIVVPGGDQPQLSESAKSMFEIVFVEAGLTSAGKQQLSTADFYIHVRAILRQLVLIQAILYFDQCPEDHPIFTNFIHTILSQLLGFQSTQLSSQKPTESPFSVGFLLLRCLPKAFIDWPVTSASSTNQTDSRSLLTLVIDKLRNKIANDQLREQTPLLTQQTKTLTSIVDMLTNLQTTLDRYISIYSPNFDSECDQRDVQKSKIDQLPSLTDWHSLTGLVQLDVAAWNEFRFASGRKPPETETKDIHHPKEASRVRLLAETNRTRHTDLPHLSLKHIIAASVTSSIPKAFEDYPKRIEQLQLKLSRQMKLMCELIDELASLQTDHLTSINPRLYKRIHVLKQERVECKSILPTWMPGYKPCSGGIRLSCEYQTDTVVEHVQQACMVNLTSQRKLIDRALGDMDLACQLDQHLLLTASFSPSASKSQQDKTHWTRLAFELETMIRHLVSLSQITPKHSLITSSSPTSKNRKTGHKSIQTIGLSCFELLCRTLSGPLLRCPVAKQMVSTCIELLAEEFLTSINCRHELVLDMLVALPHLASVLTPAFKLPESGQSSSQSLASIYQRLMDVHVRCGAQTTWAILDKIKLTSCSNSDPSREDAFLLPDVELKALLRILFDCIRQTVGSDDLALNELLLAHLRFWINDQLPASIILTSELLCEDVFDARLIRVWNMFYELVEEDSKACSELTLPNITQILHQLRSSLSPNKSYGDDQGESVQSSLLLASYELVHDLFLIFYALLGRLATKIGTMIVDGHMSVECAVPLLMDNVLGLFGPVLTECCRLNFPSGTDDLGESVCYTTTTFNILSDVFAIAAKVCSCDVEPRWYCSLVNSFLIWLCSAQSSLKQSSSPSITDPKQSESSPVPLICTLSSSASREGSKHGHPVSSYLTNCLEWTGWQPSLLLLDSFIEVLHHQQNLASESSALFMVRLLAGVKWSSLDLSLLQPINSIVKYHRCWTQFWRAHESSSTQHDPTASNANYTSSLTCLALLFTSHLRRHSPEARIEVQALLEALVTSINLSTADERSYLLTLSLLTDHLLPYHCVLMPPTTLEGRFFGLLGAAGGFISPPPTVSPQSTIQLDDTQPPQSSLYPSISLNSTAVRQHVKRLAYLAKMVTYLQSAITTTSSLPSEDVNEALVQLAQSADHDQGREDGRSDGDGDEGHRQPWPSALWTRTYSFLSSTRLVAMVRDSFVNRYGGGDQAASLVPVLAWLRTTNLLSEIEVVAPPVFVPQNIHSSSSTNELGEYCREIVRLIAPPLPSWSGSSPELEQRIGLFANAIHFWLTGQCRTSQSTLLTNWHPTRSFPRSADARMTKPMINGLVKQLLTQPVVGSTSGVNCGIYSIRLSEAALSSFFNFYTACATVDGDDSRLVDRHFAHFSSLLVTDAAAPLQQACLKQTGFWTLLALAGSRFLNNTNESNQVDSRSSTKTHDSINTLFTDLLHWISSIELGTLQQDESSITINGGLLLIALGLRLASDNAMTCDSTSDCSFCQSNQSSYWSIAKDQSVPSTCSSRIALHRLLTSLAKLHSNCSALKPSSGESKSKSQGIIRFRDFIQHTGSLIQARAGSLQSSNPFPVINPTGQLSSDPADDTIISTVLVRLESLSVKSACKFLLDHSWPDLPPNTIQLIAWLLLD